VENSSGEAATAAGPRRPADCSLEPLRSSIEHYYAETLRIHGATPLGVGWLCQPSQELRFVQLAKLLPRRSDFSINDIGCGYGALLSFLLERRPRQKFDYLGVDLSSAMIDQANQKWAEQKCTAFLRSTRADRIADYAVASGIFNIKLDHSLAEWEKSIRQSLCDMRETTRYGFAVNFLKPLSSAGQQVTEMYAADRGRWAVYCEDKFNAEVEVLEDYGMREYTLLVRPCKSALRKN
jgi:SAM-dependent methyltransferase